MPNENKLHPYTIEQLSTVERIIPERIAEITHDVEAGERCKLDVVLENTAEVALNVSEKTQERFAFMGSMSMYALLNEMKEKNPQIGDLMLLEQRIAGGKNDFDVCVGQGRKQAVMQEFGWDKEHIELSRGKVGTCKEMVDLMERQEKTEFPWQPARLDGETIYVQNPEDMIFNKINLLVNPGLDDDGNSRKREIKCGVDTKILKTYLMVEKEMDPQALDDYLAKRWEIYAEAEKYGFVTQLAEQFDSAGSVQQLLTPVLEKTLSRAVTDLRSDLLSSVGNGSEELVDGLLAVKDKAGFVEAMKAVVDYRTDKPSMTFKEAQLAAGEQYTQLLGESVEASATSEKTVNLEGYIPSEEQLRQVDSLLEITKRCEEADVVIAVVGGYGLDGLYGKLTRPHDDIDILVVGDDLSELTGILGGLGYQKDLTEKEKDKNVYRNENNLKVEFSSSSFLSEFADEGVDFFVPPKPNASLNGQSFRALTLQGQKKAVEIQNMRARKQGWSGYPKDKRENQEALMAEIEIRGVN